MSKVFDAYAAYYDLLYQDKDYAGEATFVHDLLRQHGVTGENLLELGSGTGRHAEQLARLGYCVTGVDMSAAMVKIASARTHSPLTNLLKFQLGDIRTARLNEQFDAVISLFHVASYQTTNSDLLAMFRTAAEHLKPGGILIFDYWYGPAVISEKPTVRIKQINSDDFHALRLAEPTLLENDNIVDVNYTILITENTTKITTEIKEKHSMRYLFIPELRLLLELSGFSIHSAVEWMTGLTLSLNTWNGLLIAKKH